MCPLLTQVHADGEIWSATNYDIRQAMNARYGAGDPALQHVQTPEPVRLARSLPRQARAATESGGHG
jgi:hypothetical protein